MGLALGVASGGLECLRWVGAALAWWVGFDAILRPCEIARAGRANIALPDDLADVSGPSTELAVLAIRDPKTRRHGAMAPRMAGTPKMVSQQSLAAAVAAGARNLAMEGRRSCVQFTPHIPGHLSWTTRVWKSNTDRSSRALKEILPPALNGKGHERHSDRKKESRG